MNTFHHKTMVSVCHPVIDNQHDRIFNILSKLQKTINYNEDRCTTRQILEELVNELKMHFRIEESMMVKAQFHGYREHKKEHDTFLKKIISMQKHFNEGRIDLSNSLVNHLNNWIIRHIEVTDKKYIGEI